MVLVGKIFEIFGNRLKLHPGKSFSPRLRARVMKFRGCERRPRGRWTFLTTQWPHHRRMARQYLAFPATSAGVERLFSKAGLTFDDLRNQLNAGTLEDMLFSVENYWLDMYEGLR